MCPKGREGSTPFTDTMKTEEQKIQDLLNQGYIVEVAKPSAQRFSEKHHVYQNSPSGRKKVVVDDHGNVVGSQG